jgi:hypothetical protein
MQSKVFKNAPKFSKLAILAAAIQTGDTQSISKALYTLQIDDNFAGTGWQAAFAKLADTFADGNPRFSIFALGGNSKLPFVSFSTLPGVTCPGAGECINFCYSYRAWRYPAAFARMAQNAWLMRFNRYAISAAFDALEDGSPSGFDFRLYVDGDFSSVGDLHFWMTHIRLQPTVRAYGYSKSFALLLVAGPALAQTRPPAERQTLGELAYVLGEKVRKLVWISSGRNTGMTRGKHAAFVKWREMKTRE